MRVVLDSTEVAEVGSLAEALERARVHAEEAGRVVVQASVDGRDLTPEELGGQRDPGSVAVLELTTADPRELIAGSLDQAVEALERASKDQTDAADLIEAGDLASAMPKVEQALSLWNMVKQVVERSDSLLGGALGSGADGADHLRSLGEHLREVERAMREQDPAGLSDVLRVELCADAERWGAWLAGAATRIRGR